MMTISNRSVRWLQIILTIFYGQILSTGIYEYLIQGICGFILRIRPKYDSILLLVLAIIMFAFVIYAIIALWYCRTRMCLATLLILVMIFALTLVQSILEIIHMGLRPTRIEWILIRFSELIIRILGIALSILFLIRLRQGYKPENF
jgi:hypothetical protein